MVVRGHSGLVTSEVGALIPGSAEAPGRSLVWTVDFALILLLVQIECGGLVASTVV